MTTGSAVICEPGHDVGHLVAPEGRHGRQHAALVRDGLGHDHVERADPVRGHHEQAPLAGVVELAHLARVDPGELDRHNARQRVGEAVDVAQRAGQIERRIRAGRRRASPPGRLRGRRGRGGAPPRPGGRRAGRSGRPRRGSARRKRGPAGPTARRRGRASPRSGSGAPARGGSPVRPPDPWPCAACNRPAGMRRAAPPARPSCARCRARATTPRPRGPPRGSRAAAGPARRAARRGWGCACAAWPSCPSGRQRRAPPPRPARCGPGGVSRCT